MCYRRFSFVAFVAFVLTGTLAMPLFAIEEEAGVESSSESSAPRKVASASRKDVPPVVHSNIGESLDIPGKLKITLSNKRQGFERGDTYDADIKSPKSVSFSLNGKKFYVNSLEGGKTVVYDSRSLRKLKTISHRFKSGLGANWLAPSGLFSFTHYPEGASRSFMGKPVESALSVDGRYLFVPYYRRTFDINAQDPSALAVIDTRTDSIALMTETGPLPKMVAVSGDGHTLAVTHWGDNTVALMDISNPDPRNWKYRSLVTIHHRHPLNYSLTHSVDRDSGSGYALRGTLFLPGDSLLLVSAMAGQVAVVDARRGEWLGFVPALSQVRHIVMGNGRLYFSVNRTGEVLSLPLDSLLSAVDARRGKSKSFSVNGLRRCKVGGGARTISLSPSGKFLFAACNSASALYVVDTDSMTVLGTIPVDSYPVGLDISPDGSMLVVTSQGRKGFGGNAVNIFKVEYAEPEPAPQVPDTVGAAAPAAPTGHDRGGIISPSRSVLVIAASVLAVVLILAVVITRRRTGTF